MSNSIHQLSPRIRLTFAAILLISLAAIVAQVFLARRVQAVSTTVVVSQVYGGGGNTGATYKNDFIELFNRGGSPVSLNGWSVQYAATTGTSWQKTDLTNVTLQPGQYYLIQEAAGAGGTTNLPTPDAIGASGGIAMAAGAGKVALLNNQTLITSGTSCPGGASVVDFVGYGAGTNCFEGSAPTATLTNTTAALRAASGCTDTDSNSSDFSTGAPAPRNTGSTTHPCGTNFTLTVNPAGTGTGTVTSSPAGINCGGTCSASYASGTSVTLTATANAGSVFTSWSGCDSTSGNQCTVTMTANKSVTATYTAVQQTLNVSKNGTGGGSVTSNPAGINCGPTCTATYSNGTSVTLTATPDGTSTFTTWSGCDSTSGNTCTVAMNSTRNVTATFTTTQRVLTVNRTGTGTGTVTSSPAGINCGATCVANYANNTPVTLTAVASSNSTFDGWTGCDSSSGNTCNVTMTGDKTITASFTFVPTPPGAVVISQIYGGGGNAGATYKNDFIEIFNRSSNPIDLTGWSVQYNSATGTGSWSGKTPLSGTIPAGGYFLVKEGPGAGGTVELPTPDVTGTISMGAVAGKVALVTNTTTLNGCPSGSSIIDLVGYGSTANCSEGTPVPDLGNTVAAIRTHSGCRDTDVNSSEFKIAPPSPRNSSTPLHVCSPGDLEPEVFSTTPADSATSIPLSSNITVQFDEPVNVSGAWFGISCSLSGAHSATVTGGPTTFTINPDMDFMTLEQCTVTIYASNVTDQDAIDPPDNMAADYSWSFLTGHDPQVNLTMGNPSNATADESNENNYLMEKDQYSLSYNRSKATANWVSWQLDQTWLGSAPRQDTFRADDTLPAAWYHVLDTDYQFGTYGFDRGHMCPSADRTATIADNSNTFLMTNMVPQASGNNQGPWGAFENYLRTQIGGGANRLYIISGPAGVGGNSSTGHWDAINTPTSGVITVPSSTWKVALVMPTGDNDVSRVNNSTRTIAVIMPNNDNIRPDDWKKYLATVRQVESLSGYNFYSNVAQSIQDVIEPRLDAVNDTAPQVTNQTATTDEDNAVTFTLTATDFNINNVLSFSAASGPAHGALQFGMPNCPANLSQAQCTVAVTYTPAANYNGPDSFTFTANDGALDSNTATVSITVNPVNDAPIANNQSVTTNSNNSIAITLTGSDVETAPSSLVFAVTSGTGSGSLSGTAPNLVYTPNHDFCGSDSLRFTVTDTGDGSSGALTSSEGTVSITVNDTVAPTITTPADMTVIAAPGADSAVVNFTVTASDSCGGVNVESTPASGSIFPLGTTTVHITATDDAGNIATSTFNVTVKATSTVTVSCPANVTYTGSALEPCTANVTGAGGLNQALTVGYLNNVNAGTATANASYSGDATHEASTGSATFTIDKATPTITWNNPADIIYGTALSATQLNATANVPGTFSYTPTSGTMLNAGAAQPLLASFTPTDAANYNATSKNVLINVLKATPSFSNLSSPVIAYGTATTNLSGKLSYGSFVPTGSVAITLNGVTQSAAIQAGGNFSSGFATGSLAPTNPPYTINYSYAGDGNFNPANGTGTLTVGYNFLPLYDQTKVHQSGSTIPIKIAVTDSSGANISSADLTVTAIGVSLISTTVYGPVSDSGNSNPDNNFRFTNDSYTFNLKTTGLSTGVYNLYFTVGTDPTVHAVQFQIR